MRTLILFGLCDPSLVNLTILMILYFSSQYDFATGHCTDLENILYFSPKFQNFSYLSYSSDIYKVGFCTKVEKNTSAKYVQKYYSNGCIHGTFLRATNAYIYYL